MTASQPRDKPLATQPHTPAGGAAAMADGYAALHQGFRWHVPEQFNMAQVCCARWAALPDATKRIAIKVHSTGTFGPNDSQSPAVSHSFAQLQQQANRLAHVLQARGVQRGDRVAIIMPQRFETAVAYIAVLQMGAVAMPLSLLFGPEALAYRLADSDAVAAICDASALANLQEAAADCPLLRVTLVVGGDDVVDANSRYAEALVQASDRFTPADTLADEAAVLIYTSGTTGPPKGALIPHRALLGNLTGFVCSQNWFGFDPAARPEPVEGQASTGSARTDSTAVFWSPADWAWTGGLMDALLPTLYFGCSIVAFNGRFSPQAALELMRDHGVTHTFIFPTALKAMMKAYPAHSSHSRSTVRQQFQLKLQAIMSAGEAVGDAVFSYCEDQLGVRPNEMFGQTEINYVVGNCDMAPTLFASRNALPPEGANFGSAAVPEPRGGPSENCAFVGWPSKPGSMGKAYPGHRVQVIDDQGNECPVGVPGDVAVNRFDVHGHPDPVFFLGYWKNAAATAAKFTGDWCRTGDLATRDADGYLWYQGRADDVFKAAGYRIGPGEVENCLVKHPAVANAAVVPKPDAARGALVKAYVVLAPEIVAIRDQSTGGYEQFDAELVLQLQLHVKGKLAPYEYPKEIEFVDALPMTTTGKVQRRILRLQEEARAKALSPHSR